MKNRRAFPQPVMTHLIKNYIWYLTQWLKTGSFAHNLRNKTSMPTPATFIQHCTENQKSTKKIQIGEAKQSVFTDDMFYTQKILKNPLKNLELINWAHQHDTKLFQIFYIDDEFVCE